MDKLKKSFLGGVFQSKTPAPPKPNQSMIVHEDDELLRKRAADIKRLEQENQVLRDRKNDLEKNVAINKEIIGAIIDSI